MRIERHTVTLQGLAVPVTHQGSGPPLLLLHGGEGPQEAPLDRLAYAALVYVGDSPVQVHAGAERLLMAQAGFMIYDETLRSMHLFKHEVYPRLQELTASYRSAMLQELRQREPYKEGVDLGAFGVEFVR